MNNQLKVQVGKLKNEVKKNYLCIFRNIYMQVSANTDEQKQLEKYALMTRASVKRLVVKMAIPTIISMLVTAIYNVVDAAFIGHLSTEATAGVGVSFAYMIFVQAIGFFLGHGSGNYISRALGAQNTTNAAKMASTGFFTALIIGTISAIAGLCFLSPLSRMMGSTSDILLYSNQYLFYILLATPFMMTSMVMNNQLRLQGSANYAMVGLAMGAVVNVFLDPLFIFVLHWGVKGASFATLLSQLFSCILLFLGTRKAGNVHIKFQNFKPALYFYKEIVRGGLPSLCRQSLICISTICLNRAAAVYAVAGQEASTIAAFAIVSRIMMFAFSVILGFGQGFQPVCGFNYGAKLYARVKESYVFCMTVATVILLIMGSAGYIFAPQLIAVFRSEDAVLLDIGTRVLRWQCLAFPLIGLTTATNMLFQTIGRVFPATVLSLCRQGLFFIPILLIVPPIAGLQGLEATQAIADVLTFLFTLPFAIKIYKELAKSNQ